MDNTSKEPEVLTDAKVETPQAVEASFELDASEEQLLEEFGVLMAAEYTYAV